jgi:hypothetical protein
LSSIVSPAVVAATINLGIRSLLSMVTAKMPVSSFGYVNRLKTVPFPLNAKRYGLRNPNRDLLAIFMVRACLSVGKDAQVAITN